MVGLAFTTNIEPVPVCAVIDEVDPLIVIGPVIDPLKVLVESAIWDLAEYKPDTNAVLFTIKGAPVVIVDLYWTADNEPLADNELVSTFVKNGVIIVGPFWITNTVPWPLWVVILDVVPIIVIGPVIVPLKVLLESANADLPTYKPDTRALLFTINGVPVVVVEVYWTADNEPLADNELILGFVR